MKTPASAGFYLELGDAGYRRPYLHLKALKTENRAGSSKAVTMPVGSFVNGFSYFGVLLIPDASGLPITA